MTPGIPLPIPPQRGNTWLENLRRGWSSSIRNLSPGNLIGLVSTKTTVPLSKVPTAPPGRRDSSSCRLRILLQLPKEHLLPNQARRAQSKRWGLTGRNQPIKSLSKLYITTDLSHRRITCGGGTPLNKTSSKLHRQIKGLSSRMRTVLTLVQRKNNSVHLSGTSPWNVGVPMWSNSSRTLPRSLNSLLRNSSQLLPSSLSS
jgi:hypothetical protein